MGHGGEIAGEGGCKLDRTDGELHEIGYYYLEIGFVPTLAADEKLKFK